MLDSQGEERELVVVDEAVVPRRARAVIAGVVAAHVRVAFEPAGVVVEALPSAVRPAGDVLAVRHNTIGERTGGDLGRSDGRSMSTQWKKSVRGRSGGTSRSSWLTSSGRVGTSRSWTMIARLLAPSGTPDHARCGLRFGPKTA